MLTGLASESHYLSAVAPVWLAIDPSLRREFMVPDHLFPRARQLGVEPAAWHYSTGVGLVASERDLRAHDGPVILCEHGAGQSYAGDPACAEHPGYAGGDGRGQVILFLCPNEHSAERNRRRWPDIPTEVIGSPRLPRLRAIPRTEHEHTIAVAFHWGAGVCPESGSAWYYWRDHLEQLTDVARVIGTGHPRAFGELEPWYEAHGIIPLEDFEIVVAEADLLVADNTSIMYEWAALDRPVVALNDPSWRRDVHHGLRFWDAIPGPQVDHPADLLAAVEKADTWSARRARAKAARAAFSIEFPTDLTPIITQVLHADMPSV